MKTYNKDFINKVIDYFNRKDIKLPATEIHERMGDIFPILINKVEAANRSPGGLTEEEACKIVLSVPKYFNIDGKIQLKESMHVYLMRELYESRMLSDAFIMMIIGLGFYKREAIQLLIRRYCEIKIKDRFIGMEKFISMIPSVSDYIKASYDSGDIFEYRFDVFENLPKTNKSIEELKRSLKTLEKIYDKVRAEEQEEIYSTIPIDVNDIVNIHKLLASKGDIDALHYLGNAYEFGHYGLAEDKETARRLYEMAIKAAREKNINNDAELYYKEADVYVDLSSLYFCYDEEYMKAAIVCLEKAANQGHSRAQYMLSEILNDYDKKIYWLEQAADNGFLPAQDSMGCMYQYGWYGVTKNDNIAATWFRKVLKAYLDKVNNCSDEDVSSYYVRLGNLYYGDYSGIGKNYPEAMKWYSKAVEERAYSYDDALYKMGMMYYHGWGCNRDEKKANEIYERLTKYHGMEWEPYE